MNEGRTCVKIVISKHFRRLSVKQLLTSARYTWTDRYPINYVQVLATGKFIRSYIKGDFELTWGFLIKDLFKTV